MAVNELYEFNVVLGHLLITLGVSYRDYYVLF